jgi:S-layer homology domain
MNFPRRGLKASLAFVCGLLPFALSGQSYGIGDQVLTIGAASFRGRPNQPVFQSDGYLYNADPNDTNGSIYEAPLRLPDGAVVTQLCASLRNAEPSPSVSLVGMAAIKLVADGSQPVYQSITFVNPSFNSGYEEFCTDPFAYAFHDDKDIDFNGPTEHVTHRLRLIMPGGATVGFGGARLIWHRQVSAAPATATFPDVPASHPFFAYVEALAASAITGGCGNGNFCPDAPLTRGQMAVFLAKALGLHWVN